MYLSPLTHSNGNRISALKRWIRGGAFALALLSLPAVALAAKPEASKEALQELKSRIESLKKELDTTKEAHSEAADALKKSEQAISEVERGSLAAHALGAGEARRTCAAEEQRRERLHVALEVGRLRRRRAARAAGLGRELVGRTACRDVQHTVGAVAAGLERGRHVLDAQPQPVAAAAIDAAKIVDEPRQWIVGGRVPPRHLREQVHGQREPPQRCLGARIARVGDDVVGQDRLAEAVAR